jgi:hypothetical protein
MKKYISLILLITILFVSNGYYLYFKHLQHKIKEEIKHEIKNKLSDNELSVVIISSENKKQISWKEKDKEFSYNGEMYDIVKTKTLNNKTYYYCIKDTKEKNLIANYTRHNRRRNKTLLKLRKVLSNKYFPEKFIINTKTNNADIYFTDYQQNYTSVYLETLSPPPKF